MKSYCICFRRSFFGGIGFCIAVVLFAIAPLSLYAQVGVGTNTPDPSAQLDVAASDKGLLAPRVTNRNSVQDPADGLIVYQTGGERGLWIYDGSISQWVRLAKASEIPTGSGGTIIPFASGIPITLSSNMTGAPTNPSFIGFGNGGNGPSFNGESFTLSTGAFNYAFSVPRDGTITDLFAFFSIHSTANLPGTTISVSAELYQSTIPDNLFTPIPGTKITLSPSVSTLALAGTVLQGKLNGLSIPVASGTRCVVVFYINTSGADLMNGLSGYASGGLNIY